MVSSAIPGGNSQTCVAFHIGIDKEGHHDGNGAQGAGSDESEVEGQRNSLLLNVRIHLLSVSDTFSCHNESDLHLCRELIMQMVIRTAARVVIVMEMEMVSACASLLTLN